MAIVYHMLRKCPWRPPLCCPVPCRPVSLPYAFLHFSPTRSAQPSCPRASPCRVHWQAHCAACGLWPDLPRRHCRDWRVRAGPGEAARQHAGGALGACRPRPSPARARAARVPAPARGPARDLFACTPPPPPSSPSPLALLPPLPTPRPPSQRRLKRASDLSLKHVDIPKHMQEDPFREYETVQRVISETQFEVDERKSVAKKWWLPYHLGRETWHTYDVRVGAPRARAPARHCPGVPLPSPLTLPHPPHSLLRRRPRTRGSGATRSPRRRCSSKSAQCLVSLVNNSNIPRPVCALSPSS